MFPHVFFHLWWRFRLLFIVIVHAQVQGNQKQHCIWPEAQQQQVQRCSEWQRKYTYRVDCMHGGMWMEVRGLRAQSPPSLSGGKALPSWSQFVRDPEGRADWKVFQLFASCFCFFNTRDCYINLMLLFFYTKKLTKLSSTWVEVHVIHMNSTRSPGPKQSIVSWCPRPPHGAV